VHADTVLCFLKLDFLTLPLRFVQRVFELDGATVVIDEASLEVLKGSKVDYKSVCHLLPCTVLVRH
jgi:hypothetical protein